MSEIKNPGFGGLTPTIAVGYASHRRWAVVASLFLFMSINFADKAVLGLVAVPLMHDMQLSTTQFGIVGSAFFLLFSVSGIATGLVAERHPAKWLIFALALVWAVAQLPLGWPTTFAMLLACRILLGAGEGPAAPLALHVVYTWFEDHERNLPTTIVLQGATVGVIVSAPLLTFLATRWNWHVPFVALAAAGFAWLLLWLKVGGSGSRGRDADGPSSTHSEQPGLCAAPVRYRDLLTDRTIVGTMLQSFVGYAVVSIGFTWAPAYLHLALGFPLTSVGWLFALQVAVQIPVGIALTMVSQRMRSRGVPSRYARGALISGACMLGGLAYLLLRAGLQPGVKVALMALAGSLAIQTLTFGPLIVAEVVPGNRRAAMLTITNSIVTLAGLVGPFAMGKAIASSPGAHGYELGFTVIGILLFGFGASGFVLLDPRRSTRRLALGREHATTGTRGRE